MGGWCGRGGEVGGVVLCSVEYGYIHDDNESIHIPITTSRTVINDMRWNSFNVN